MTEPHLPRLRYLPRADVEAAMPPVAARIELAERAMVALVGDAELPPKLGVHPRPDGSFAHAMPAFLRGAAADGSEDRLGIKWVVGFPTNNARGLPAISALVVLNDPGTGIPTAILDGGPITAHRTAAVSGVAIRRWAPEVDDRPVRAAIVGAGVQGRAHLPVLGHLLPGVEVAIFDRHPERADALVELARRTPGIGAAAAAPDARSAIAGADVVVTCASFTTPERRQVMTPDWLAPNALVVPVDYATYCSAEVARTASLFLVDERDQFLANRAAGQFDGYPDPTATFGEAILRGLPRPPEGRVVATHLGVGLADVVFGSAIVERATELGLGQLLVR
ncbi:MAG TPA: ornithine cyclodeaminase family protein [Candidatus Binatia bacterium]|nr:ornithine cyclodeaminase family protein [Candidatus Binatia bacterium]